MVKRDGLEDGYLAVPFVLWEYSLHPHEYAQLGFSCAGLLHASVAMLFEYQVGVHPDYQPPCRFFVESNDNVSHFNCGIEFFPELHLVESCVCEESCIHLCCVKLEILPTCPVDALGCTGFEFHDHPHHILPCYYLFYIINSGESFESLD